MVAWAGAPSLSPGSECPVQACTWHHWGCCGGSGWRKTAACSCRCLGPFYCSELAREWLPGPRRVTRVSCGGTWSSWRWRACWEYSNLTGWAGCSGWGRARCLRSCSVYGTPWCRTVGDDASLAEVPSLDCRILGREFETDELARDRFSKNDTKKKTVQYIVLFMQL